MIQKTSFLDFSKDEERSLEAGLSWNQVGQWRSVYRINHHNKSCLSSGILFKFFFLFFLKISIVYLEISLIL